MSVENTETGITTNRKLRNFDDALESDDRIGMVISDADTGKVVASLRQDGAVEAAERLAAEYGFEGELRDGDAHYGRRMFFEAVVR